METVNGKKEFTTKPEKFDIFRLQKLVFSQFT